MKYEISVIGSAFHQHGGQDDVACVVSSVNFDVQAGAGITFCLFADWCNMDGFISMLNGFCR